MSGSEAKYPWGNAFEPSRANTWFGGRHDTVSVDKYPNGATGNGVYQLVGNVWEWVAAIVGHESSNSGTQLVFEQPMAEIRGGAFDTYFSNQATCQFRSGQPLVLRADNVGFRCCASVDQLRPPPGPSAFLE
jgi:iron(II)-dependent oxidoreductase